MTLSNIDTGYMIQLYLARGSSEAVAIAMISLQQVWLVTVMTVLRSCCQGDCRYAALQYGLLQTMSASQSAALTIERMQVANRVGAQGGELLGNHFIRQASITTPSADFLHDVKLQTDRHSQEDKITQSLMFITLFLTVC